MRRVAQADDCHAVMAQVWHLLLAALQPHREGVPLALVPEENEVEAGAPPLGSLQVAFPESALL